MDENEILLFLEDANQLVIEDGYSQVDNPQLFQDDTEQFLDNGEANQTVIEDGYQQQNNAQVFDDDSALFQESGESFASVFEGSYQQADAPVLNTAQLPPEPDFDWSEPLADYQFNHFANVDAPSLVAFEEPWFDADVEHDAWWWSEENGYATGQPVVPRQEGDDISDLAMDFVAEDILNDIARDDITPASYIPLATVTMPYLIGMMFQEAFTIVESIGLVMLTPPQQENVIYPFAPEPAGTVIQQYPLAGTQVAIGSSVYVIVSSGFIVYPQGDAVEANVPNTVIGDDTGP